MYIILSFLVYKIIYIYKEKNKIRFLFLTTLPCILNTMGYYGRLILLILNQTSPEVKISILQFYDLLINFLLSNLSADFT